LARRHGWSDDQIEHLGDFEQREDFSAAEKAALRLAGKMTSDPQGFDDDEWSVLRRLFDEGEIIELAASIGLFNYFNRFNDVLKMEPTR
jgi:alkylhydroperoxidase family enzyme